MSAPKTYSALEDPVEPVPKSLHTARVYATSRPRNQRIPTCEATIHGVPELTTQRLYMRRWQAGDRAPFAELNGDPEVVRHFPAPLTRRASDELADRLEADVACRGWGLWALEERATGCFIGFTGLAPTDFEASFTPGPDTHPTAAWRFLLRPVTWKCVCDHRRARSERALLRRAPGHCAGGC